jgi:hypothetical protein
MILFQSETRVWSLLEGCHWEPHPELPNKNTCRDKQIHKGSLQQKFALHKMVMYHAKKSFPPVIWLAGIKRHIFNPKP